MSAPRRRALLAGNGLSIEKTVLIRDLADPNGTSPFTRDTGFTAAAGSVLTLFVDFDFSGSNSDNLIGAGLQPAQWVSYDGLKIYLAMNGDLTDTRFHFFDQTYDLNLGSPQGHHKMVCRIRYLSSASAVLDVWMDGAQILAGRTGGSVSLGAIQISNAEGVSRFHGIYHEISLIHSALRDDQLQALTAV